MKLLEKLNIDLEYNPLVVFGSYFGSGKSTILTILSSECYNNDKKILYLTETKGLHTIKKFNKALNEKNLNSKLTVVSLGLLDTDLELFFKKGYDLIVIDYPYNRSDIDKISKFSSNYKTTVFLSVQLSRFEPQNGVLETNRKPLHASDVFVIVTKKDTKEQSILAKLMFWKKQKNVNLRVFKNKFGNEFSLDVHVDFENVKFKC
jgi:hypothetical protein